VCPVREVDQENYGEDTDGSSDLTLLADTYVIYDGITYHSLHYKYPSPSPYSLDSLHLHKAEGQNPSQGRGHTADEVEYGESLLDVI
jgi:hypothetical protein